MSVRAVDRRSRASGPACGEDFKVIGEKEGSDILQALWEIVDIDKEKEDRPDRSSMGTTSDWEWEGKGGVKLDSVVSVGEVGVEEFNKLVVESKFG